MNPALRTVLFTSPYVRQARDLFDRFTTPPATDRRLLINTLIKSFVQAGIWDKLDAFYMLAAADAQSSLLNWVSTSYNLTVVSTPTFTADRGYKGNGTSSYLRTGFNPATAVSPKSVLNSASMGVYINGTPATGLDRAQMGIINGANYQLLDVTVGNAVVGRMNTDTTGSASGAGQAGNTGLFAINRTGSTASRLTRNGTDLATTAVASTSVPSEEIIIMARYSGGTPARYSTDQFAMSYIGAGLSDAEDDALYSALNVYLTALGAA